MDLKSISLAGINSVLLKIIFKDLLQSIKGIIDKNILSKFFYIYYMDIDDADVFMP